MAEQRRALNHIYTSDRQVVGTTYRCVTSTKSGQSYALEVTAHYHEDGALRWVECVQTEVIPGSVEKVTHTRVADKQGMSVILAMMITMPTASATNDELPRWTEDVVV